MKLNTLKRYLAHYPPLFLAGQLALKTMSKPSPNHSNLVFSSNELNTLNLVRFKPRFAPKNKKSQVLKIANSIAAGKIYLFDELISVNRINSSFDYLSKKPYSKTGCDMRVVWEINRGHDLLYLAQAFAITKNKRHMEKFVQLSSDWINKNPDGVNWLSPMEVAIRAVNWCTAAAVFYPVYKNSDFWHRFFSTLYKHGTFIRANLEYTPKIRGNHYLANLIGLAFLGALFENGKHGKEWIKFSKAEFEKEIRYQVLHDGVNFEKSTWYHGFTTEIFLTAFNLFKTTKLPLSKEFERRLGKTLFFLHCVSRKNGSIVQIGDSDSGRLFRFYPTSGFEDVLEYGTKMYKKPGAGLHIFDSSGFVIYRDENILLTFFAGSTGTLGTGGHTHNSALSFTLDINSKPVLIDPGTFIYTGSPELRNTFRSTKYHNTICIDGAEQNYFDESQLFKLFDETKAEITFASKVRNEFVVSGRHYGYASKNVIHERLITINPLTQTIKIRDWLSGKGHHKLNWNFHVGNNAIKLNKNIAKVGSLSFEFPYNLTPVLRETWFSTRFGKKKKGKVLSIDLQRVLSSEMFLFNIHY